MAKPALPVGTQVLEYAPIGLKKVAFDDSEGIENTHHTVAVDTGGTYVAPHWEDNSDLSGNGIDGDADDGEEFTTDADRKFPVCYRWGSKMNASCRVFADPSWGTLQQGQVFIKGAGDGGIDFPSREAAVGAGNPQPVDYPATDSTGELPENVHRMEDFNITWEISTDSGSTWHYAGTSENEVFVYRPDGGSAPGCSTNFRTVMRLGTDIGGQTNDGAIVSGTWSNFMPVSGVEGNDVCGWRPHSDPAERGYKRPLYYYKDGDPSGASDNASDLLEGGNGNCTGWARLLGESFRVNNVLDANLYQGWSPFEYQGFPQPIGAAVIGFADHPKHDPPLDGPNGRWKYGDQNPGDGVPFDDLDRTEPGIPGQNENPPSAKLFNFHEVVLWDGVFYDPSYGVAFDTTPTVLESYTEAAIDAWANLMWDGPQLVTVWSERNNGDAPLNFLARIIHDVSLAAGFRCILMGVSAAREICSRGASFGGAIGLCQACFRREIGR